MISALLMCSSGAWIRKRPPSTPARVARRGKALERLEVVGAAVGIAGVIERVRTDGDVARVEHFGPRERQRQKNGVPRGDVRGRDVGGVHRPVLRHGAVSRQGRAANRRQVHAHLEVLPHAQGARDRPGRLDLTRVALAVQDAERADVEAVPLQNRRGGVGIETAAQKDDRARHSDHLRLEAAGDAAPHTPRVSGDQMYLCTCSCTRTGKESASTHSASVRASSTPCTGENSTAATRSASAWRASTSRAYS